jgi:hypothetical protein
VATKKQQCTSIPNKATFLGTGILSWDREERQTGRYGFIYLLTTGNSVSTGFYPAPIDVLHQGERGALVAQVTCTRKSTHGGDPDRNILPRTPRKGDCIELGTGILTFRDDYEDGTAFVRAGVQPEDGRDMQWMNIRALYDVHEQTVSLYFVPGYLA